MAVTLNFTSKGLIDAIQRQLAQQKSEGKISGDISYKNITTCEFWSTLNEINTSHQKNNKIFHGKSYSCDNRGQNTDWTKSVVVYGTATLSDDEWEALIRSMGLEITSKTQPEETKVEETAAEKEEPVPVKKRSEEIKFNVSIDAMAVFVTELQKNGYDLTDAEEFLSEGYNIEYNYETETLVCTDKEGNRLGSTQIYAILQASAAKRNQVQNDVTGTNPEADEENCTDDNIEE